MIDVQTDGALLAEFDAIEVIRTPGPLHAGAGGLEHGCDMVPANVSRTMVVDAAGHTSKQRLATFAAHTPTDSGYAGTPLGQMNAANAKFFALCATNAGQIMDALRIVQRLRAFVAQRRQQNAGFDPLLNALETSVLAEQQ